MSASPPNVAATVPLGVAPGAALRVCADLNLWHSAFLADLDRRQGTVAQRLRDALYQGHSSLGRVQVVISMSMLTHLTHNLEQAVPKWRAGRNRTPGGTHLAPVPLTEPERQYIHGWVDSIGNLADSGPERVSPIVFDGGSLVAPSVDTDLEDSHVLATALSGGAHVLVSNDAHFINVRRPMVSRARVIENTTDVLLYEDGTQQLLMVPKERMLAWFGQPMHAIPQLPPKQTPALLRRQLFRLPAPPEQTTQESSAGKYGDEDSSIRELGA